MISVIIPTHNAAATIGRCLRALYKSAGAQRIAVTVVDTASADGTIAAVEGSGLPVDVHRVENRGFAVAANAGAARAQGSLLLFLNPDALLPEGGLPRLAVVAAAPGVCGVSGLLVDAAGRLEPVGEPFPRLSWYVRRRLRARSTVHASHSTPFSVPWLSGAALLVRTDDFRAVGGFCEDFFLYYEDIDLCRRLRERGGVLVVDSTVMVRHVGGTSAPPWERLRESDTAEEIYFRLHRPQWEGLVLRVLRRVLHHPFLGALILLGGVGSVLGLARPRVLTYSSALAAALAVVTLSARRPDHGALLLLGSVLCGQLLRVSIPLVGAVTITDVLLPLIVAGWTLSLFLGGSAHIKISTQARPPAPDGSRGGVSDRSGHGVPWYVGPLIAIGAIAPGLLLALERLPPQDWLMAAGYTVRFLLILALIPLGAHLLRRPYRMVGGFLAVSTILALLGFLQLRFAPSTLALTPSVPLFLLSGFDPHVGRLFATWLDPNLLGGLFALTLALLLGINPSAWRAPGRILLLGTGAVNLGALFLTKSRAGLLALAVAAVGAPLVRRSGRRLMALVSAATLGLVLVPGIATRLSSPLATDPTAQLRLDSWRQALVHTNRAPLFGLGYNVYAFEQQAVGNIQDLTIHSRAGADNSFLTLVATTGVWGGLLLAVLAAGGLWTLARGARAHHSTLCAPAFLAVLALLAHAQFVHSLVYIHLAVPLALLLAAAAADARMVGGHTP